jgi:hypothetical protein
MGVSELAARLLTDYSVHLPQWRKLDPIGRLQRARSDQDLLAIFAALGDRHTHCALPTRTRAWLPFMAGACNEGVFVTGSIVDELRHGDRIVRWNSVPIAAALRALMPLQLGANRVARAAKAMQTLTFRPLSLMPPPEEQRVMIELDGERRVELPWRFDGPETLGRELAPLFSSSETMLSENISISGRTIRITSFVEAPEPFLRTFLKALESVPQNGVIIDLMGCEEGIIQTAEQLLQLFTSQRIEPEPFRFRMTDAIRNIADRLPPEWRDAIRGSRGVYSRARTITSLDQANQIGRRYDGPLVVLVGALTYSSAEMFAAGVQDHGIGKVIGIAPRTGGGGASAWSQKAIADLSGEEDFRPRTEQPSFRVAVRSARRVLRNEGRAIERTGIIPDILSVSTRTDLLERNRALLTDAERILAEMKKRR